MDRAFGARIVKSVGLQKKHVPGRDAETDAGYCLRIVAKRQIPVVSGRQTRIDVSRGAVIRTRAAVPLTGSRGAPVSALSWSLTMTAPQLSSAVGVQIHAKRP